MRTRASPSERAASSARANPHAASPTAPSQATDDRRAWRDRNRDLVVDTLLDLFSEGNLNPGAQEVADRSGVSRRSVFRYFDDMEGLCRAAIEHQIARVSHLLELPGIGRGLLADRIKRLVAQRLRVYDAIAPVAQVSRLRAPFQPVLAEELKTSRAFLRRQVEEQFAPELGALTRAQRREKLAAADVLCSYESFALLREAHGLTIEQTGRVLRRGLAALLSG
jgi:AcrR family transcriptional regulator